MGRGTGVFKMASAFTAITNAFAGAAVAAKAFGQVAAAVKARGEFEPRVKGRNRRHRGTVQGYHPDTTRFARKSAKFGSEYRPGKLFKGHRI